MLKLTNVVKEYSAGDTTVEALKGISVEFRDNEFVSVLGPSGCGKTTLLNIIGGLDRYTNGDLSINGRSTKQYKDSDWDAYRNHSIGFVFQTYNLIPHQTVLSNVELALTLSGVSKAERRQQAKEVLEKVGLGDQIHKRPNQMSGGQMQRVAIARALVNNPDILLADEPTGALDSETSVQIMGLLKEIAKDRLIIMVTHNPELAAEYSTRIIKLLDGKIIDDTNPYTASVADISKIQKSTDASEQKKTKQAKTSMSFFTALSLSLNNLMTKKTRTLLTAFAGSIGIIGIALILSLQNGVDAYITQVEEDTLSSYPITIQSQTVDLTSMMSTMMQANSDDVAHLLDKVYSSDIMISMMESMTSEIQSNDLKGFKSYLDSGDSGIQTHSNAIQYGYDFDLQIYKSDTTDEVLQVNPSEVTDLMTMGGSSNNSLITSGTQIWNELIDNPEVLQSQYEVLAGSWPDAYDEVVLIVDQNNEVSDMMLYSLGLKDSSELTDIASKMMAGEEVTVEVGEQTSYTYDELLQLTFKVVLNSDYYKNVETGWVDQSSDPLYMKALLENALDIKIAGIVRPSEDGLSSAVTGSIGYTSDLTKYVIEGVNNSEIVKQQLANPAIDVFTGKEFVIEDSTSDSTSRTTVTASDTTAGTSAGTTAGSPAGTDAGSTDPMAGFDTSTLTPEEQAYIATLSKEELAALMESYAAAAVVASDATYDENLSILGVADLANPSSINIYPIDFAAKEAITDLIKVYNNEQIAAGEDSSTISYTDLVGLLMSSVTTIINAISYILIAFVAISLVVSSIMIGIITYISVLERTKEIGILRSIGASKKDVSRVFNAETLIVGLVAGLIGIGLTLVLSIPINIIIKSLTDISGLAALPAPGALLLIGLSTILTLIAGVIPSRLAAKKDPVVALRTE